MKTHAPILASLGVLLIAGLATAQNGRKPATVNPFNLLKNADFRDNLKGWDIASWKQTGKAAIDSRESFRGKPALRLDNRTPDHSMANQIIAVKPNTRYRISAMVKTKGIAFHEKGRDGACLGIRGTFEKSDPLPADSDWTLVVFEFDSKDRHEVEVGPHLGWHASVVTGTAWFSDIQMEQR